MEYKLAPSILAADFMRLGEQIDAIGKAGAQYVHYDVMDGIYVPSISFGLPVLKSVRKGTDLFLDCHLMIMDPDRYIDEFAECGADSITVHVEACHDVGVAETLRHIRRRGLKCGLTLNPRTPIGALAPYLGMVDMVLVMSVEPGFGGQKLLESTYGKLAELLELKKQNGYDFDIEVDGGVTKENLASLVRAGVNVIVSGSSIFKGDIEANVKDFFDIIAQNT
ncbi:MAG: ribulose-phosphate 3-epimerase [Lachnospiraceae bacterium]|nr:ribulose-phosphate 3-epimerase [Lachnospiraceae bacterium]MBO4558759.1 ribulose-phosphate 3-epimerase [Lachnospiraceae bacterium]